MSHDSCRNKRVKWDGPQRQVQPDDHPDRSPSTWSRKSEHGFFYNSLVPTAKEGPQWRRVEGIWVATNRHVLLPTISGTEVAPERVILYLRRINEHGMMEWLEVAFAREELERRVRLHPSKSVDIALVDVMDCFTT